MRSACKDSSRIGRSEPSYGNIIYQKIRRMIAAEPEDDNPFDGKVEVDKSYFGGRRKGKRGHGSSSKIPVFGILKHQGKVYTKGYTRYLKPNANAYHQSQ